MGAHDTKTHRFLTRWFVGNTLLAGLFAAARSIEEMYAKLHRDGTTKGREDRLTDFAEFNELIGVDAKYELAERFKGTTT